MEFHTSRFAFKERGWESAFLASLTGSGSYGGSLWVTSQEDNNDKN